MCSERIYKYLFILQSVVFTLFLMQFISRVALRPTPKVIASVCTETAQRNGSTMDFDKFITSLTRPSTKMPNLTSYVNRTRGRLSNCTLDDVRRRPGVLLLTTANYGFTDITLNMFASMRRVGVCVKSVIIAEDSKAFDLLSREGKADPAVRVLRTDSGDVANSIRTSNRRVYFGFLSKRQGYVLKFLEQGFEVLFSDSDTFWFRDPFPYFQGEFDISLAQHVKPPRPQYCAGFVYYKPTNTTVKFVRRWVETMAENKRTNRNVMDQVVMNSLLNRNVPTHVNARPLNDSLFPWGDLYYRMVANKANFSTVVMHAANIRGHDAKVAKFKSSSMWLVNATSSLP